MEGIEQRDRIERVLHLGVDTTAGDFKLWVRKMRCVMYIIGQVRLKTLGAKMTV